jgi:hypothetical protein
LPPEGSAAVENIGVSSSVYRSGGLRSLAVTVSIGAWSTTQASGIAIAVPLCASTGSVNLSGYTFSAWVRFSVTSGSIPANAANLLQGMLACRDTPTRGTSGYVAYTQSNANSGTWVLMSGVVNQASTQNYLALLTIGFPMANPSSEGFRGTMYVDDVRLAPP